VRSIFQHFDDLEGLHAAVSDRYIQRVGGLAFDIDPCLALADRVALAVDQRSRVLEAVGPTRRAATVHAPFSDAVKTRLQLAHQVARDDVERVFRPEAEGLDVAQARLFFDSLSTALSWMVWDNLRTFVGRDAEGAADVVTQLVWGVLRQWTAAPPTRRSG
jgi:AcrR family transcriptional regulator